MTTKKATQRQGFKTSEFIVYPAHGVGQIVAIEEQEVAGAKLELFVINFVKDKMTLRVPTAKARPSACASSPKARWSSARSRRSRAAPASSAPCGRAAPRNTKPRSIPATSSPLPRSCATCSVPTPQPEQSYSERQLYEAALDRLSREIAAVQRITETEAIKEIEAALAKGPRRGPPSRPRKRLVEDEAA